MALKVVWFEGNKFQAAICRTLTEIEAITVGLKAKGIEYIIGEN